MFVTPRQLLQLRTSQLNLPPCINDADGVCTMEPIDDTHGPGQCVCWGKVDNQKYPVRGVPTQSMWVVGAM